MNKTPIYKGCNEKSKHFIIRSAKMQRQVGFDEP